ncbi:MAG TPA: hypothetical protein VGL74_10625 [Terriglobales bacterium]|jgi:hypothetical protein
MRACLLIFIAVSWASGQAVPLPYPYLLRLDHYGFDEHACALLQNSGAFHLEIDHGDDVRVQEGSVDSRQLAAVQKDLDSEQMRRLSQQQIEEPIMRTRHDRLQVTILRGDGWQNLYFASGDSQQPFKQWLQPLVRWLDGLHKVPHRELSEDAGKNNCLPPKVIALQRRGEVAEPEKNKAEITMQVFSSSPPTHSSLPQPTAVEPAPVPTLLHLFSQEIKSGIARERCLLIAENGEFRLENRVQKAGSRVSTEIALGQMGAQDVQQLRQILDDPHLANLKHREPPGGRNTPVPILGNMLELAIMRPAGNQRIVLTSAFGRPGFPAFYGGDADISEAGRLLKFLDERTAADKAVGQNAVTRNGCTDLQ